MCCWGVPGGPPTEVPLLVAAATGRLQCHAPWPGPACRAHVQCHQETPGAKGPPQHPITPRPFGGSSCPPPAVSPEPERRKASCPWATAECSRTAAPTKQDKGTAGHLQSAVRVLQRPRGPGRPRGCSSSEAQIPVGEEGIRCKVQASRVCHDCPGARAGEGCPGRWGPAGRGSTWETTQVCGFPSLSLWAYLPGDSHAGSWKVPRGPLRLSDPTAQEIRGPRGQRTRASCSPWKPPAGASVGGGGGTLVGTPQRPHECPRPCPRHSRDFHAAGSCFSPRPGLFHDVPCLHFRGQVRRPRRKAARALRLQGPTAPGAQPRIRRGRGDTPARPALRPPRAPPPAGGGCTGCCAGS